MAADKLESLKAQIQLHVQCNITIATHCKHFFYADIEDYLRKAISTQMRFCFQKHPPFIHATIKEATCQDIDY